MYSAYKLNKQGDDIQPWHTPFPIWNQSVVPCPVLTVASWPAYRFLRRQVRWSGIPISWRIFQFVVIYIIKGFGVVNEGYVFSGILLLFLWSNGCWQFILVTLPFLNPACESSSQALCMMYSAYKLNKQGDNIQLWRSPFPVLKQSVFPCPVLTVAFLTCVQIPQETGKVFWYSHLLKNFPVCCNPHSQRL